MNQNTYYVATLSQYVLVQASDENHAKELGQSSLPTPVRTVRLATKDEVELMTWHNQMSAK